MKLREKMGGALLAAVLAPVVPNLNAAEYRVTATIAVLPGNPHRTRIYSLNRAVFTPQFFAGIGAADAQRSFSFTWREPSDFVVLYLDKDAAKASAVVNSAMKALIGEVDRRRAAAPRYGTARVLTAAHAKAVAGRAGAEGILRIDGMSWDEAARKETQRQLTDLPKRILNPLNVRESIGMAGLITPATRPEENARIMAEVRSSVHFYPMYDSWLVVTMVTSDIRRVALLGLLLSNAEKHEVAISDRIPEADLDFVRPQIRRDWYIFNCCGVKVKE